MFLLPFVSAEYKLIREKIERSNEYKMQLAVWSNIHTCIANDKNEKRKSGINYLKIQHNEHIYRHTRNHECWFIHDELAY